MPVNKSVDRLLKAFFDESPRMFLHVAKIVPLGRAVELEPLPRETSPPVVMPDTAVRVRLRGGANSFSIQKWSGTSGGANCP